MTAARTEPGNRTVVGNISLSLDGRFAGPGGEHDMSWVVPHAATDGSRSHMVRVTAAATTALLGRKNYQGFASFWPAVAGDEMADPRDRAFAQWLNTVEKVVISSTLQQCEWRNSRVVASDPAAAVRQLRKEEGGDIVVLASASVIRNLLEAGELDRLSITLCPELVGGGARLFDDGPAGSSWSLTGMNGTDSGAICLLYDRIRSGQRPRHAPDGMNEKMLTTADDADGRAPRPRLAARAVRPARLMITGRMPRRAGVAALVVLTATAVLTSGCGGPSGASALQGRLLSVADLPAGWSAAPTNPQSAQTNAPCLPSLPANPDGGTYATASFVQGTASPTLSEVLATGPQAQQRWQNLDRALMRCRTATITIAGTKAKATIQPLSFPRVASTSSAYAWAFTIAGIHIGLDLVLFTAGTYAGYLTYADLGPPAVATVQAFVNAAVAKAEKGSTAPVTGAVSIASAPVQTAHTKLGTVAYRIIGSGPPLVLITGYGGTMEDWDRRFVDALAQHYRVVIFDNAGVGQTQALPAPLSIDAMANQTSALIDTLGLGRPDVLGWSMGSMIAQALAVLHPDQVRSLVLCASYPGNGTTMRPSQQAIDALTSGNSQKVMADLFPAGQTAAQNTFLAAISSYPAAPAAPAGAVTAQGHAVDQWWAGSDPAGTQTATINVPTLIADGTADRLDPPANSHTLAGLIPGAKLTLYPDAGHAFLFQDQAAFVPLIESFLS